MNNVTRFGPQLLINLLICSLAQPVFAAGKAPTTTSPRAKAAGKKSPAPAVSTAPSAEVIDPAVAAALEMAQARAEAQSLKNQGDTLFRAREFAAAIDAYQKSYATYPDARVLYNEARSLQALGRYSEALGRLNHFAQVAAPEIKAEVPALPALQADLRSRVAEVVIRINQPDAQVTFHNQPLTVAAGPILVDAGEGLLRVTKEGFFAYERQVTLRGGGSASFDVALGSIERHAQVSIKSRVAGSAISIDGQALAQAPTEALVLPGTHRVVAHREGYSDASTQVILVAGQHRELELNPLEQHPLLGQWWFWAGAAVVVAGGVTTAIVIARHQDGTNGDFSPSIVSGPLSSPLRF